MRLFVHFQLDEAEKNWNNERTELLQDQAGLQKLHNNLQQDYDSLFKEKEAQKETERTLKADLRKLQVCKKSNTISTERYCLDLYTRYVSDFDPF